MDRKDFFKKSVLSLASFVSIPTIASSCSKEDNNHSIDEKCSLTPSETKGPFPNLTPSQLVRASIIGNRTGVAMLMTLTILKKSDNCQPLQGVYVDVWQCDKDGYYSQYGNTPMQNADLRKEDFLRGRQTTDEKGQVSFLSIFPGWYRGRAPHIHLEVISKEGKSLLISQIAFPKDVCDAVYATPGYRGPADTSNERDGIFADSLKANMADALTGNTVDGYTLLKTIII